MVSSDRLSEVQRIAQAIASTDRDGICTAEALVDAARDVNSPIHGEFVWDDAEAGEEWRREQARRLLRRVTIIREVQEDRFVRVKIIREQPQQYRSGYMPASAAFANPELRTQVLREALNGLRGWVNRNRSLHDLAVLVAHVEEAIERYAPEI